jgi:hypothetical protein
MMGRGAAVVVLAVLALAGAADARPAAGDSAAGIVAGPRQCGSTTCLRLYDAFDVHSGAAGEHPSGIVRQYLEADIQPGIRLGIEGPATCLSVVGNRASIGFVANQLPGGIIPSTPYATLVVEDNGNTGTDRAQVFPAFAPVTTCPDPRSSTLQPTTLGDLTVHDALTRPQARAACLAERSALGRAAFRARYGTPGRAFRNCVSQKRA